MSTYTVLQYQSGKSADFEDYTARIGIWVES
jgi:hypothetical protein